MRQFFILCTFVFGVSSLFGIYYSPSQLENKKPLHPKEMKRNPMEEFQEWYQQAQDSLGKQEAAAMVLATVSPSCTPFTLTMLAKNVNNQGITFFGDLRSQKFQDLKHNPAASVTFNWLKEQRQVTIMGKAVPVSQQEAKKHFDIRHRHSQISSHVAEQEETIESHQILTQRHAQLKKEYKNKNIPTPSHWGGYRLEPQVIAFWQAGPHNLHSHVVYTKEGDVWKKRMVAP